MARIRINAFRIELVGGLYEDLLSLAIASVEAEAAVGNAVYILPSFYNHDCGEYSFIFPSISCIHSSTTFLFSYLWLLSQDFQLKKKNICIPCLGEVVTKMWHTRVTHSVHLLDHKSCFPPWERGNLSQFVYRS